jgi:HEAT repeat protein
MKQLVMLSLLENQSASERIKAVSYAEALPALDPAVRDALVRTLDADQNPNVRLAAAEALGRFPESEEVRQALVNALEREPDAMLQITLIQLLVNMEEKRAARSIERLIRRDSTPEVVRKLARKGLNALKES